MSLIVTICRLLGDLELARLPLVDPLCRAFVMLAGCPYPNKLAVSHVNGHEGFLTLFGMTASF